MKKLLAITLTSILLIGCSSSSSASVTKTCTLPSNVDTITLKGTGDTLETLTDSFATDLSDYSETEQQELVQALMHAYGNVEGIKYDYNLEDGILTVSIEIDIKTVSEDDLALIGLNLDGHFDSSMKTSIENFEADGYTCE